MMPASKTGTPMFWKALIIIALGAPAIAVLIFEIVLNAMAMFNHANIRLPVKLDSLLRVLFVTPDMHRVHHSANMAETNSNYGFNFAIWDRVFKTYTAQPAKGHEAMKIGLNEFDGPSTSSFIWALLLPFRKRGYTQK